MRNGEQSKLGGEHERREPSGLFDEQDVSHGLAKKTVVGGLYFALSSLTVFIVNTAGIIVITRNLTDQDFGLYGMVLVLTGFAALFVDIGLAQAVIQKPKITHDMVSTLFWINLAIATLIAMIVAASTPLLIWFYNEPRLAPINLVMSLTFIVSALRLQHQALLRRKMAFRALSLIDAAALIVATVVAVLLAFRGAGVWALVALHIVAMGFSVVCVWAVSGWVPGLPGRGHGVREMLVFGGNITGTNTVGYFSRNLDNIMLGFAWGAGPLGLYTRAYSLMLLPVNKFNNPMSGVVVPVLSRLTDDPDRYERIYMQMVRVCVVVLTPLVAVLILTVHATVPLFLGDHWLLIIPIFYALAPACVMAVTSKITNWIFLTYGRVDRQLRLAVCTVPFTIIGCCIGVQFGPIGVAVAMSTIYVLRKPIGIAYAVHGTTIKFKNVMWAISFPIIASAIASLVAYAVVDRVSNGNDYVLQLILLTSVFITIYLLLITTPLGGPYRDGIVRLKNSLKTK